MALNTEQAKHRGAIATWFDMVFNLAIFSIFMFKAAWIAAGGLFVLFPAVVIAVAIAAYYAYKEAQSKHWDWKSTTKFVVDLVAVILIAIAVAIAVLNAAGVIAASELIAPAIFAAALNIKALYSLGMFIYTVAKDRKLSSEAISYLLGFAILATIVVAVGFVLLAGNIDLAFIGMIGAGVGLMYIAGKILAPFFQPEEAEVTEPLLASSPTINGSNVVSVVASTPSLSSAHFRAADGLSTLQTILPENAQQKEASLSRPHYGTFFAEHPTASAVIHPAAIELDAENVAPVIEDQPDSQPHPASFSISAAS